jgi:hypothetical protein
MFISESGLLRYARLAFCAATVVAVSTSGSLGKQPNQKSATPEQATKLDATNGFRGQNFGTAFSDSGCRPAFDARQQWISDESDGFPIGSPIVGRAAAAMDQVAGFAAVPVL